MATSFPLPDRCAVEKPTEKKRSSSEIAASHVARLRRRAWYEEVVKQYQQGKSIAAIARELQMSPTTVRKFVYAGAFPERSAHKWRQTYHLTPYLPYRQQRVADGCENASMLWQEICLFLVSSPICRIIDLKYHYNCSIAISLSTEAAINREV